MSDLEFLECLMVSGFIIGHRFIIENLINCPAGVAAEDTLRIPLVIEWEFSLDLQETILQRTMVKFNGTCDWSL